VRTYRLFVRPAEAASPTPTNVHFSVFYPQSEKLEPLPRAGALSCLKVAEDTFIAINCGRDTQGFCYWLGKAAKAPYKAVDDWTDHSGTKIKKGDFVIDLIYWDRPSTDDPLLFEDEAKKATVHAEHVLHANVAPTAAADDRVRVSEEVVAEIEAEYELFLNT
jgi:hypothetical protein